MHTKWGLQGVPYVGKELGYLGPNSFGFSMFSPWGAKLRNWYVQFFSTLLQICTALGLLGGALMNSRAVIVKSLNPL